jgi:hypothetical protein
MLDEQTKQQLTSKFDEIAIEQQLKTLLPRS